MIKEKIIQVTSNNYGVWGLTESGCLAIFDDQIGHWIVKGEAEIKTVQGANLLRPDDVVGYFSHDGKYENHAPMPTEIDETSKNFIIGLVGLVVLGVGMYLLFFWR